MIYRYRLQLQLGPLKHLSNLYKTEPTDMSIINKHTGNIVFDPLQGHPVLHLISCNKNCNTVITINIS
jgi:hypothetical protein